MRLSHLLLPLPLLALPAFAQEGKTPPSAAPSPPAQEAPATPAASPAAGAASTSGAAFSPPTPTVSSVAAALATLEGDPLFAEAAVAVQVVNASTGEEVYAFGDDRQLVPASTMKLLTTATALRALGPDWRFPTWILHDGELKDGVLDGNLYVKGQGDPSMVVERMWRMVLDVKLHGIKEIKGDVVFDDAYFADTTLIPGWDKEEDLESRPTYFAPLGALSVNYNIAAIVVRPGSASGQPAIAEFESPSPVVAIENHVTTGSRTSRMWFRVESTVDEETGKIVTYKVTGNMPAEHAPDTIYRTIADPLGNYVGVYESISKELGIKVKGKFRAGLTSPEAELLFKTESDPLAEIVSTTSKHSNNFMAEQMLRAVGAERYGLPGTTAKGIRAVEEYLTALGIPKGDFRLVNGSGLSRDVLLRPSHVNAVLVDMWQSADLGPEFAASLSVGGRDGTLWSRFREDGLEGRVRGKTGTLNGVHCLAGYVRAMDDETYAFTFLVNDIEGALSRARKAHDRLVLTVAGVTGNIADSGEVDGGSP
ncbi:MAG: D-alanyl-D-alanine carboxypeptidase/D-alanyl-D-alanine endopeptidase [Myxococcota bacterium]